MNGTVGKDGAVKTNIDAFLVHVKDSVVLNMLIQYFRMKNEDEDYQVVESHFGASDHCIKDN